MSRPIGGGRVPLRPCADRIAVFAFCLLKVRSLLAQLFVLRGHCAASRTSGLAWRTGGELDAASLLRERERRRPAVLDPLAQQVPEDHRELARHGDRGGLRAAADAHPLVEGVERPGRADRVERGLDEQAARVRLTLPADVAGARGTLAGLAHGRFEPEVPDELVRPGEALDRPDDGEHRERGERADTGDREQQLDTLVADGELGDRPIGRAISAPRTPRSRSALSTWARSSCGSTTAVSQRSPARPKRSLYGQLIRLRMGARRGCGLRSRVRCWTRLARCAMRRRSARVAASGIHTSGMKSAARSWASTRASTSSVLHLASAMARVRSGLETTTRPAREASRIRDRPGVRGGLEDDLVVRPQLLGEVAQRLRRRLDALTRVGSPVDDGRLREAAVDVEADGSHAMTSLSTPSGRHDN